MNGEDASLLTSYNGVFSLENMSCKNVKAKPQPKSVYSLQMLENLKDQTLLLMHSSSNSLSYISLTI